MEETKKRPKLPPRWFVRLAWKVHRGIYRASGGRKGLRRPSPGRYGMMRLTTTGRRSGEPRPVILAYFEDGPHVVTMAMNGWAAPEPAWWLNLQAQPEARLELIDDERDVVAREVSGAERERLWEKWREYDADLDAYAQRRPTATAVVVLERR